MRTLYFSVPDIMCYVCVASIENAIRSYSKNPNTIQWHSPRGILTKRCIEVSVTLDDPCLQNLTELELTQFITTSMQSIIASTGFYNCTLLQENISQTELTTSANNAAWRHALIGSFAVAFGMILLISMMMLPPLPTIVLICMGIISVLATICIGFEFYVNAWRELRRGQLGMDVLFAMSTLTVIIVIILSFVFPWLPMLFEAGLLVFGFRHIGLAIKHALFKAAYTTESLQDNVAQKILKYNPETSSEWELTAIDDLKPSDIIMIESDAILPLDGELVAWPGRNKSKDADVAVRYVMTEAIDGAKCARCMHYGEELRAGMRLELGSAPMCVKLSGIPSYNLIIAQTLPIQPIKEYELVVYPHNENICAVLGSNAPVVINDVLSEDLLIAIQNDLPCTQKLHQVLEQKGYPHHNKTTSYLSDLAQSMRKAHTQKALLDLQVQGLVNNYFIPSVILIAVVAGFVMGFVVSPTAAIICVINILVAACPCTIALIVPLTLAIARDKLHGIQILQEQCLPALAEVTHAMIDLNGTLTDGKPYVDLELSDMSEDAWHMMLSLEVISRHPIGMELFNTAKLQTNSSSKRVHFTTLEVQYSGVIGEIGGDTYCVGDAETLQRLGMDGALYLYPPPQNVIGGAVIYLVKKTVHDVVVMGHVVVCDKLRPGSLALVAGLKARGIEVALLTGASLPVAEFFANQLGIETVHAAVRRDKITHEQEFTGKEAIVRELKLSGKKVLMLGDALNDADAFVAADVSILLRHDQTLTNLSQVVGAIISEEGAVLDMLDIAQQSISHIYITMTATLLYNIVVVLLSSGVMASLGIMLTPGVSAALMCVPMLILLCSISLLKYRTLPNNTKSSVNASDDLTLDCEQPVIKLT